MLDEKEVVVRAGAAELFGTLTLPGQPSGIVVFAHGSGSSRHSPRNRYVAGVLSSSRLATLLFDLLTLEEEAVDDVTAGLRFDIRFLSERLERVTEWLAYQPPIHDLPIGYFGSSTGAAATLRAAAQGQREIGAIVS